MNYPNYKKLEEFAAVLFVILSGFITTAVFKLNNFWTFPNLDEMLWHTRSRIFWDKILEFDFSGLIQSAQPGITVYWFTGFLMKFIDFDFFLLNRMIEAKETEGFDFNSIVNANNLAIYKIYEPMSFAFNAPMLFLTVIFFLTFYHLIKKLGFNRIIASFSLLFLATNIFFTYWNTPSDKMLNIFLVLSFLTLLVYVDTAQKNTKCLIGHPVSRKKYLILSAIFGALAVLSKLTALFIVPFYFLVLAYYSWPINKNKVKSIIKDYFIWIAVFIPVCVIFLPTIITNPGEVYDLVFGSKYVLKENYSATGYFSGLKDYGWLMIQVACMAPGSSLFLLVYIALKLKKRMVVFGPDVERHTKAIIAFILLFMAMVTVISSNHDTRFMSPVFVLMNILSAIGFYAAIELIRKQMKLSMLVYPILALILVVSQLFSIVSSGLLMDAVIKKYFGM